MHRVCIVYSACVCGVCVWLQCVAVPTRFGMRGACVVGVAFVLHFHMCCARTQSYRRTCGLRRYQSTFQELLDNHTRTWMDFIVVSRWLGSRLDMLVLVIITVSVFGAISQREKAANVGLTLAYLIQLSGTFQWMVRQSAEFETQLTSAERVVEYTQLPCEEDALRNDGTVVVG